VTSQIIPVDPFDFVIFGGTGDLARRKLLPALYMRDKDGQVPDQSRILAISRGEMEAAAFRELAEASLREHASGEVDEESLARFLGRPVISDSM